MLKGKGSKRRGEKGANFHAAIMFFIILQKFQMKDFNFKPVS